MRPEARRWQPWLPGLILVMLVFAANWQLILDPTASFGAEKDLGRQFMTARYYSIDAIKTGQLPKWNPYNTAGTPYIASGQTGFFYPVYQIHDRLYAATGALPTPRGMSLFAVAQMAVAALGMMMLSRSIGTGSAAAMIGGLAFGLSGFLIGHAGHQSIINGAIWIPWGAWALICMAKRPGPLNICGLAAALAMPVLAGHPPTTIVVWAILGGATALIAIVRPITLRSLLAFLAAAGVGATFAVGLAAAQSIPALEFAQVAARPGSGYEFAASFSFPRRMLAPMAAPRIYGADVAHFSGPEFAWEYWGYAGMLPLLLAPLAFWWRPRRGSGREFHVPALLLAAAAIAAVLLMLGRYGPIFRPLVEAIPELERIRVPGRWVLIYNFAVALLAALGADALVSRRRGVPHAPTWPILVAAVAVSLAVAWVVRAGRWWTPEAISGRGAAIAIGFVLISLVWAASARRIPRLIGPVLLAVDLAVSSTGFFIVHNLDPFPDRAAAAYIRSSVTTEIPEFRVEVDAGTLKEATDNGFALGLPHSNGEDSLTIAQYHELRSQMGHSESPGAQFELFARPEVSLRVLDLLNARYLFTRRTELSPDGESKYRFVGEFDGVRVYENPDVMPKVWLVSRAVVIPDAEKRAAAAARLDPTEVAVLSAPPQVALPGGILDTLPEPGLPAAPFPGTATVREYERESLAIDTDSPEGAILATGEMLYPGWVARVDSEPVKIIDVQHALRGVYVPPGIHKVTFEFESQSLKDGMRASRITLILFVILFVAGLALRRRSARRLDSPATLER